MGTEQKIFRRDFLKYTIWGGAGLALQGCFSIPPQTASARRTDEHPNILFIFTDDQGWLDLGCYGHPVLKTPNLDRLASEGCRFTNFYVTAPVCSPSRAGCLTGRIQNRFNMQEVLNPGLSPSGAPVYHHLPLEEPTFPRQLQQAGYRTGHVGKWHLSMPQFPGEPTIADYGFDYYCTLEGSGKGYTKDPTDWTRNGEKIKGKLADWTASVYVDEAIQFIESTEDRPFFLNIWTHAPHEPLECAESYKKMYAERTEAEQIYFGSITQLDDELGRLFKYLDHHGLSENTMIIFTSDNGPELFGGAAEIPDGRVQPWGLQSRGSTMFRDRKHDIYEGGIRVPAIIRWPGRVEPGTVSHVPVSTLDLFPTLCAVTGAPLPVDVSLDGGDLRPALKGQSVKRPHSLYWQFDFSRSHEFWGLGSPPLAIREGGWKLMCDKNFENLELYNLDIDPAERWNFAKGHPEIAQRMLADLRKIYQDVNQPYPKERYLNPYILELRKQQEEKNSVK